jgi:hypothetical protein
MYASAFLNLFMAYLNAYLESPNKSINGLRGTYDSMQVK